MATLLLQAAGAFAGGLLGSVGATIGTAAGALAGYVIDKALVDSTRHYHGSRLSGPRPLTAEEGVPIPRIYGTVRIGATVIWATRFEESRQTQRQGFKGGPKVTTYSYFANAAFALCEGEITGIRRIWADGREIDREQIEMRLYTGSQNQSADPLIEAKQGEGNTPAYRGLAYVVFERFPLDQYGNRIPQFQFELIRSVGSLNKSIRAVTLIPGATEFGLSPQPIRQPANSLWNAAENPSNAGGLTVVNRHVLFAPSDLSASLDELQMLCPNLEHVALVASWFGDDLRAAHCQIRPLVTVSAAPAASSPWTVSGLTMSTAEQVSRHEGAPAFGGSPSDLSVIQAIAELKNRNLKVTLYPFVMMDIPAGNNLPDPDGGPAQPSYPWRGRITCFPGPGQPGSADKSAEAASQIDAFCGYAIPADFIAQSGSVTYAGPQDDWGYRRMILHYAKLSALAGGVDAFLIGSELRGLTTLRSENNRFPFVEALTGLAAEVRQILGANTVITYGADWTEYFGYQPADGSGDVFFHLDPLWANAAIGAIGIDNYMPLTDWRDVDYRNGHPDFAVGPHDINAMRKAISGGEGFDYFYASWADRLARKRTPITDGAYQEPWTFRYKDIGSWWSNFHFDRPGGVAQSQPTEWLPGSKSIWMTELGCPAADKGANQPNVFSDPKSGEDAAPYFSSGGRDELIQRRYLEAQLACRNPDDALFSESENPLSPIYDGRMVDISRCYLWCWDARPFPAFPASVNTWSDAANFHSGHWLNGRLGSVAVGDLINAILSDHGLAPASVDHVTGTLTGYLIDSPGSARAALEPIMDLVGLAAVDKAGQLELYDELTPLEPSSVISELVAEEAGSANGLIRNPDHALPREIVLHFRDPMQDYQAVAVRHLELESTGDQVSIAFPGILEASTGQALAAAWLRRKRAARDEIFFRVAASNRKILPGSVIEWPWSGSTARFMVIEIEEGIERRIRARRILALPPVPDRPSFSPSAVAETGANLPLIFFLDLPMSRSAEPEDQFRIAASMQPWRTLIVSASPENTGFVERSTVFQPAVIGFLNKELAAGPQGRPDLANRIELTIPAGELASVSDLQFLNGANAMAVRSSAGSWEIIQFRHAVEIAPAIWQLSGLLRAQLGTEDAMLSGAEPGSVAVLLDDAVVPAGLNPDESGLQLHWRAAPTGMIAAADTTTDAIETGGLRALQPLSPVHLSYERTSTGDYRFSWIRRGRIGADSWLGTEIPLGEETEAYRVRLLDSDAKPLRDLVVNEPEWICPNAELEAGVPPGSGFDLVVSQISARAGEGISARKRFLRN